MQMSVRRSHDLQSAPSVRIAVFDALLTLVLATGALCLSVGHHSTAYIAVSSWVLAGFIVHLVPLVYAYVVYRRHGQPHCVGGAISAAPLLSGAFLCCIAAWQLWLCSTDYLFYESHRWLVISAAALGCVACSILTVFSRAHIPIPVHSFMAAFSYCLLLCVFLLCWENEDTVISLGRVLAASGVVCVLTAIGVTVLCNRESFVCHR